MVHVTVAFNMSRDMTKLTKWLCAQRRLRSAWANMLSSVTKTLRSGPLWCTTEIFWCRCHKYAGLIDNIFVEFGGRIFQQTIGIPMGTNYASLLADLFLYSYDADFVKNLIKAGKKRFAQQFNFAYRYRDDVLSLNNPKFQEYLELIYPRELEIKETTETTTAASHLDCYLCIDNGELAARLYDKLLHSLLSVSEQRYSF